MLKREPIGWLRRVLLVVMPVILFVSSAVAGVTSFFDASQVATLVATGTTSDTISSEGYRFTNTLDKLFTGGVGLTNPIGRPINVTWPQGVEAQYVTAGPNPGNATITIRREDGAVFDLTAFTAKILANPGAGRAIEIVPLLNGEEPLNDPLFFDVSNGSAGSEFSFDALPNYLGSTVALTNYDTYKVTLSLDFALTALTLESAAPNMNHAPTDILLSSAAVLENEPAGTWVGTFDTLDPDAGDTFTYALVTGTGSTDNAWFTISGSDLLTVTSFNYEVKSNYSIRAQSTDQGALSTQKVFAITILDVDETPVILGLEAFGGSNWVLRWSSVTNHLYTVHAATNLLTVFVPQGSNIMAMPVMNVFTDVVQGLHQKFWKVTTEP